MSGPSYTELLKDPRWQRRRLEILNIADFQCQSCDASDRTLHVHHRLYRKGAKPWEYADHELQALCEACHQAEHLIRHELTLVLATMDLAEIERVLGYAQGLKLFSGDLVSLPIKSIEQVDGLLDAVNPKRGAMASSLFVEARAADGYVVSSRDLLEVYSAGRAEMTGAN